ncbi:MAG: efflux transporter outer membrane subunit [Deltaproteobacteria bacterium]|nr:efflux transporter outer membrane subunit [Deltaproteobacteria bacterium]
MFLIGASCSPYAPGTRKSPEGRLPKTFSLYKEEGTPPQRWWEAFGDTELNAMVEEALSDNFTLQEAWARLRQANARVIQKKSSLYPELDFTPGYSMKRQKTTNDTSQVGTSSRTGTPIDPVTRETTESFTLGIGSSYELDLWGKIRSETEAERLTATATREDLNAAAMTVAAEVTQRWVNIISQRMQKQLLEKQLQTNNTYLELVELRFRKAMVSALDVYQQRQVVERVKADIPLVESQEQLRLHELALLMGKPPRAWPRISRDALPFPAEVPAIGLPADLLANRPDVRAAGLRLRAADWQVAAARANRLPSLRLSGQASYGADKIHLLFDNWLLSLAANLVAPLFDGKRRVAEVDRTKAVVDERLLAYRRVVLTAIKEVEDALIKEAKQREHIEALKQQIETARKALSEAGERYLKGLNTYLPVLTQILSVQNLERDLIRRQAELIIDRVSLFRALGGTWMHGLQPKETLKMSGVVE